MFLQAKANFVETFLSEPIRAGENNHFKLSGNDQASVLHSAASAPKETGQTVLNRRSPITPFQNVFVC